jgi:flagellar motor switch protein FliM
MDRRRAAAVILPEAAGDHSLRPYDFLHPDRLSRRQLRALETVYREAAALMSQMSTGEDGRAEVQLEAMSQLGAQEFVASLPRPAVTAALSLLPLSGAGLLQIDLAAAFEMVNLAMGGQRASGEMLRPLTDLEQTVLSDHITLIAECLSQAWRRLGRIEFAAILPSQPAHFSLFGQAQDPLLLARFRLRMRKTVGIVSLALPLIPLEQARLLDVERAQATSLTATGPDLLASTAVSNLPVRCSAQIVAMPLPLADLRELAVGDVLLLGPASEMAVELVSGNGCRFPARLIDGGRRVTLELQNPPSTNGARR